MYQVESILEVKQTDEGLFYLVKWRDQPLDKATWERPELINDRPELLETFLKTRENTTGQSSCGKGKSTLVTEDAVFSALQELQRRIVTRHPARDFYINVKRQLYRPDITEAEKRCMFDQLLVHFTANDMGLMETAENHFHTAYVPIKPKPVSPEIIIGPPINLVSNLTPTIPLDDRSIDGAPRSFPKNRLILRKSVVHLRKDNWVCCCGVGVSVPMLPGWYRLVKSENPQQTANDIACKIIGSEEEVTEILTCRENDVGKVLYHVRLRNGIECWREPFELDHCYPLLEQFEHSCLLDRDQNKKKKLPVNSNVRGTTPSRYTANFVENTCSFAIEVPSHSKSKAPASQNVPDE